MSMMLTCRILLLQHKACIAEIDWDLGTILKSTIIITNSPGKRSCSGEGQYMKLH